MWTVCSARSNEKFRIKPEHNKERLSDEETGGLQTCRSFTAHHGSCSLLLNVLTGPSDKASVPSHPSNGSMTTRPFMRSRQIWICTQPGIHNKAMNICWDLLEPNGKSRGRPAVSLAAFFPPIITHICSMAAYVRSSLLTVR